MALNTRFHTTTAPTFRPATSTTRRTNVRLWVTQGALGALFVFAGAGKFAMSPEQLTEGSPFAASFLYFIGGAEVLGAIGLILPWALRIRAGLTPLAAAGLTIIMVGAAVTVATTMNPALAAIDLVIAAALVSVITGRRDYRTRTR
jgi:uncharacterized membrane protein YphA (DoxX/SURF4 family)